MDKLRFLYLFALSVLVSSQLTGPAGNCLGYCATCDPYSLAKCKGETPCLWGFYDPEANGRCKILPSYSVTSKICSFSQKNSDNVSIRSRNQPLRDGEAMLRSKHANIFH